MPLEASNIFPIPVYFIEFVNEATPVEAINKDDVPATLKSILLAVAPS